MLSHFSGQEPDSVPDELIATLKINKNAMILMDSDRRSGDARTVPGRINSTKRRVQEEFERLNAIAEITEGKEIENYIPHATLIRLLGAGVPKLGKFEYVGDYLEANKGEGEKGRFEANKVAFARDVVAELDKAALESVPELHPFLERAVREIKRWNSLD